MTVVDDACLIGNEFSVFVTDFGELHLIHGEVLISFIRPFALPDVDVADNFYAKETMCQHWHFCEENIIAVMSCCLHINALLVVQVQVGKFLSGFIKSHKVLHIIYNGNAWQ